jgi:hypothetical protein
MKSNKEISEYLYPYTRIKGKMNGKLVSMAEIRGTFFVEVDNRDSFPIPKLKDRVTGYLRRNGFSYVWNSPTEGFYQR